MKIKECYLIFCKGTHWTNWFEKDGFGHIIILDKDKYNWYMVEGRKNILGVKILGRDVKDNLPEKMARGLGYKIIKVTYDADGYKSFMKLTFMSCVEIAKYYIGLKCWSRTPYGLYKKLLNIDAKNKYRKYKNILNIEIIGGYENGWIK